MGTMSDADWVRQQANIALARDLARFEAEDEAAAREAAKPRRTRRVTGPSVVYSIRLDPSELRALERRAAALDIKPTALARNLIRAGLATRTDPVVAEAIDRLEAAFRELRGLVP